MGAGSPCPSVDMRSAFLHFSGACETSVLCVGSGGRSLTRASCRGRRSASQLGLQVGAAPLPLQWFRAQRLLFP